MKKRNESILTLREALVTRREAIRRALAGDLSMLQELQDHSTGDSVDIASDSVQGELSSKLVEVETHELELIDNALDKIEIGTFGICETCQCNIPMTRLSALPFATMCLKCQEKTESLELIPDSNEIDWSSLADPCAL